MPGWWCEPADASLGKVILFIHGGSYALGSAKAYRHFAGHIAAQAKINIFTLEYPLAPQAVLPTAVDVAVNAINQLHGDGLKVGVAGDSAGGGISLAATSKIANSHNAVLGLAVFSPWTDLTLSGNSMRSMAIGDILLDPAMLHQMALQYAGPTPLDDAVGSPLFGIAPKMPPTLIQVGADEILLDDSVRYAEASRKMGNFVDLEIWEGMHHVFQLNISQLATARNALARASHFFAFHLR